MKKMIWSRLKNMKCPNCNDAMILDPVTHNVECANQKCRMFIRKEKFEEIIKSLYAGRALPEASMDNQAELNNL